MSTKSSKYPMEVLIKNALAVSVMATENGVQFHTDDKGLAKLTAELATLMNRADCDDDVKEFVDATIWAHTHAKPEIELWTYIVCLANYYSWVWHKEGNDELSAAWSCAWHDLHAYSLDNLKGDDLAYYIKTTD